MAHPLLATGASLPFVHISERYDQCPFVGVALSADAEWFTRKEDFDSSALRAAFHLLPVIEQQISGRTNYCCNVTRNIEIRILNISFLVNIDF